MPRFLSRIFANVTPLSPSDWQADAGKRLRRALKGISAFWSSRGVTVESLGDDASHALKGAANEKLAHVMNEVAEAEKRNVETAALIRSADIDIRIKEGQAQRQEIDNVSALIDLYEKLNAHKLAIVVEPDGRIRMDSAPVGQKLMILRTDSPPLVLPQSPPVPVTGSSVSGQVSVVGTVSGLVAEETMEVTDTVGIVKLDSASKHSD